MVAPFLTEPSLELVQSRLRPGWLLLDYWIGKSSAAVIWTTSAGVGVVPLEDPGPAVHDLIASLEDGSSRWRVLARTLGSRLLAGLPAARHLIVVPDGQLSALPFEVLETPGSHDLLIERCDLSYLPAAQFIARIPYPSHSRRPPWQRVLVAIGDPPVFANDPLADSARWQTLPASADEIRGIAEALPGRTEVHLGADARKSWLLGHQLAGTPILHLSTHAVIDSENPDRSRILLAPTYREAASDYLFQSEAYDLDLTNVDLVTLSACDTARGKMVRGEGAQAFSQAFLAAGARATITSLWSVADRSTAAFMKQLYYSLGRGAPKAEALRAAKLTFLHSNSRWSHPRYWAAFVLQGDSWDPCARAISGGLVLCAAALVPVLAVVLVRWRRTRQ
jgi:CHAT domain-containing protein